MNPIQLSTNDLLLRLLDPNRTQANRARLLQDALDASLHKDDGRLARAVSENILGKPVEQYLHEQFPATVGHIPLRDYFKGISEALKGDQ